MTAHTCPVAREVGLELLQTSVVWEYLDLQDVRVLCRTCTGIRNMYTQSVAELWGEFNTVTTHPSRDRGNVKVAGRKKRRILPASFTTPNECVSSPAPHTLGAFWERMSRSHLCARCGRHGGTAYEHWESDVRVRLCRGCTGLHLVDKARMSDMFSDCGDGYRLVKRRRERLERYVKNATIRTECEWEEKEKNMYWISQVQRVKIGNLT
jgi:hypothetical protein